MKLAEMLDVSYGTAWHLGHRVRAMMAQANPILAGVVELDEMHAGAPPRKKAKPARDHDGDVPSKNPQGRGTKRVSLATEYSLNVAFEFSLAEHLVWPVEGMPSTGQGLLDAADDAVVGDGARSGASDTAWKTRNDFGIAPGRPIHQCHRPKNGPGSENDPQIHRTRPVTAAIWAAPGRPTQQDHATP